MFVIMMNGHVACLKTTIAAKLAKVLGVPVVHTNRHGHILAKDMSMDPRKREKRYDNLFREAEGLLKAGRSLILDGTFARARWRNRAYSLCRKYPVGKVAIIRCVCPDKKAIRERLRKRRECTFLPENEIFRYKNHIESIRQDEPPYSDEIREGKKPCIIEFDSGEFEIKARTGSKCPEKIAKALVKIVKEIEPNDAYSKKGAGWIRMDFLRENIDFTLINPSCSKKEIMEFCRKAILRNVGTIYVPPAFLGYACSLTRGHSIDVGTTAGFPYGNMPTELKEAGISYAAKNGARWVDVCLNVSLIKSGEYAAAEKEISGLAKAAHKNRIGLKLIIDSPYLKKNELVKTARLVDAHGVDYLKTASGVGNKICLDDVKTLMAVLRKSRLKVSGGISTFREAAGIFNLGADRIGSSKGFEIMREAETLA